MVLVSSDNFHLYCFKESTIKNSFSKNARSSYCICFATSVKVFAVGILKFMRIPPPPPPPALAKGSGASSSTTDLNKLTDSLKINSNLSVLNSGTIDFI